MNGSEVSVLAGSDVSYEPSGRERKQHTRDGRSAVHSSSQGLVGRPMRRGRTSVKG